MRLAHLIRAFLVTRIGYRQITADLIFLLCLVLLWFKPLLFNRLFERIERAATAIACRRNFSLLVLAVAVIALRLGLLWNQPVPFPRVHDEFSYLLAGDTFAHGRIANPSHPLWEFFDTIHVNQLPTYMSKYPPMKGAALAAGELLGHPWIGVLLSASLMCAAILWMLQGWFPSRWALLGGVLAWMRLGVSSYWINSYWGGAVPALGGALVLGALPRIMRKARPREVLLFALGAAILANSRPFEGLLVCAPAVAVLFWWLFSRNGPPIKRAITHLVVPLLSVAFACGLFMGYYNWRLTGHPFVSGNVKFSNLFRCSCVHLANARPARPL